eukprot:tig00021035_g17250.t1
MSNSLQCEIERVDALWVRSPGAPTRGAGDGRMCVLVYPTPSPMRTSSSTPAPGRAASRSPSPPLGEGAREDDEGGRSSPPASSPPLRSSASSPAVGPQRLPALQAAAKVVLLQRNRAPSPEMRAEHVLRAVDTGPRARSRQAQAVRRTLSHELKVTTDVFERTGGAAGAPWGTTASGMHEACQRSEALLRQRCSALQLRNEALVRELQGARDEIAALRRSIGLTPEGLLAAGPGAELGDLHAACRAEIEDLRKTVEGLSAGEAKPTTAVPPGADAPALGDPRDKEVYLCVADEDALRCARIFGELRDRRFRLAFDDDSFLSPACGAFVFFATPAAVKDTRRVQYLHQAMEAGRPIVPAFLDPPAEVHLGSALDVPLRRFPWVLLGGFERPGELKARVDRLAASILRLYAKGREEPARPDSIPPLDGAPPSAAAGFGLHGLPPSGAKTARRAANAGGEEGAAGPPPRRVYVSYAERDADLAKRLASDLQRRGFEVECGAPAPSAPAAAGGALPEDVAVAIQQTGCFLLVASGGSVVPPCRALEELAFAYENAKPLVAAWVQKAAAVEPLIPPATLHRLRRFAMLAVQLLGGAVGGTKEQYAAGFERIAANLEHAPGTERGLLVAASGPGREAPGAFASLPEALADADPGDVVYVAPGRYVLTTRCEVARGVRVTGLPPAPEERGAVGGGGFEGAAPPERLLRAELRLEGGGQLVLTDNRPPREARLAPLRGALLDIDVVAADARAGDWLLERVAVRAGGRRHALAASVKEGGHALALTVLGCLFAGADREALQLGAGRFSVRRSVMAECGAGALAGGAELEPGSEAVDCLALACGEGPFRVASSSSSSSSEVTLSRNTALSRPLPATGEVAVGPPMAALFAALDELHQRRLAAKAANTSFVWRVEAGAAVRGMGEGLVAGLADAVSVAHDGDTIALAPGRHAVTAEVRVRSAVAIEGTGAGPHECVVAFGAGGALLLGAAPLPSSYAQPSTPAGGPPPPLTHERSRGGLGAAVLGDAPLRGALRNLTLAAEPAPPSHREGHGRHPGDGAPHAVKIESGLWAFQRAVVLAGGRWHGLEVEKSGAAAAVAALDQCVVAEASEHGVRVWSGRVEARRSIFANCRKGALFADLGAEPDPSEIRECTSVGCGESPYRTRRVPLPHGANQLRRGLRLDGPGPAAPLGHDVGRGRGGGPAPWEPRRGRGRGRGPPALAARVRLARNLLLVREASREELTEGGAALWRSLEALRRARADARAAGVPFRWSVDPAQAAAARLEEGTVGCFAEAAAGARDGDVVRLSAAIHRLAAEAALEGGSPWRAPGPPPPLLPSSPRPPASPSGPAIASESARSGQRRRARARRGRPGLGPRPPPSRAPSATSRLCERLWVDATDSALAAGACVRLAPPLASLRAAEAAGMTLAEALGPATRPAGRPSACATAC